MYVCTYVWTNTEESRLVLLGLLEGVDLKNPVDEIIRARIV